MKEKKEKNSRQQVTGDVSDQMRSLYDQTPYPSALSEKPPQGIPLLEHWINGVYGFDEPVLFDGNRILIAGCGSGEEAISLAQYYKNSAVTGIDFSARSIEVAVQKAREAEISNVSFKVADLTNGPWLKDLAPFDFILCHGVADYVTDVDALLSNLSHSLKSNGLIYLSVNSPFHPAERIRRAMEALGVPPHTFVDSEDQRQKLVMTAKLLGEQSGIRNLVTASRDYLSIDIFPPIAHHLGMDEWINRSEGVGLCFCGSMEALIGLLQLTDDQLFALYEFTKPELSTWMMELRQPPGMQMLFGKKVAVRLPFDQPELLWNWKPKLAASVFGIPLMTAPPNQAMYLTLQFPGLPNFVIYSNAYDLEVLRNCNGKQSLKEIIAAIPAEGNMEALRSTLFRAFHYGILSS
jgi:SAM-dependent methyltransferase